MRRPATVVLALLILPLTLPLLGAPLGAQQGRPAAEAAAPEAPLTRVREGGTPPPPANQPLHPYALSLVQAGAADLCGPPSSGLLASPPEYAPTDGVIFRYGSGWNSVVTECVVKLTADPAHDEKAYVVVQSSTVQTSATNTFTTAGADLSKVVFIVEPANSIWLRDYGPHFIYQNDTIAIADSHYYPTRPKDNFIPTLLAVDLFQMPAYPMGLYYSGGNFQPGPDRSGFVTALVHVDNPGFGEEYMASLYQAYQGIDTLHIMPQLPGSVDGTGHIDMWMYIVDADSVIISEFKPGSNATAISITNNAVPYMEALGFTVHRVPAWNVGSTHYTYTNAFRVNDRIFTPEYGQGSPNYANDDRDSVLAWEAAAGPGVQIVPIDCYSIIPAAGAIHCIVMQVPRYEAEAPAAHIVEPDGFEVFADGSVLDLQWNASDDVQVTGVDLAWSEDGGQTFPHTLATLTPDDGHFDWTLPATPTPWAVVQATAHDGSGNAVGASSERMFEISTDPRSVYDFSTGAGVDRWVWGNKTFSWAALSRVRYPATASIEVETLSPGAYARLAASDGTGGDLDTNRYTGAKPGAGYESTHIIEFTVAEDPATIRDLAVLWEGYGDQCLQVELYVWDNLLGDWGDGAGLVGENRYLANWAGNVDEDLSAHIREDVGRYLDGNGRITFLLYAERVNQATFHDYVSLTVITDGGGTLPWADRGQSLAGVAGHPKLVGTGTLLGGDPMDLVLLDAAPSVPASLVVGFSTGMAPFKGGVMVPSPDVLLLGLVTDANGGLALASTWPTGVPSGTQVALQYWITDATGAVGFAASNGAIGTTP